jgi:hypothetical protein
VIEENRKAAEARVALVEKLGKRVEPGDDSIGQLKLPEGVKLRFPRDGGAGNVVILQVENAIGTEPTNDFLNRGLWIEFPREYLRGEGLQSPGELIQSRFDNFAEPSYLAILRIARLNEPMIDVNDTFSPGKADWEVYVFDLEQGEPLGVLRGTAANGSEVYVSGVSFEENLKELVDDLKSQTRSAISRAIEPYCEEGATPYFP